jgi:hypothetical protein
MTPFKEKKRSAEMFSRIRAPIVTQRSRKSDYENFFKLSRLRGGAW